MSSFSLTKQTFKEKMGRSHATLDEQFSVSWANCQQLEDIVDRIRAHMFEYLESMKAMCVSGHAVADDFKSFYERSPERLTTISIKYEMIQNGFRTDKIALLSRLLNQNVFLKMEEFKVELAGLRSKVGDREVARKRYDHYHSKIQDLRDSRTKAKAKGKELSVSDLDKLTRNERKYEDARLEYVAINRLVARALWNTWARRFQILDPIYAEVIKIKANFTQALSNQLQIVLAPLKTQMTLELREEPLPAVFAPAGAPAQAAKTNGAMRSQFGEEDGAAGYDDGEYGVMSPGGTQEMDPRKLQAKMHAATEKLETDAALAQKKAQEKQNRANQKAGRNTQAGVAASIDLEQTEEHTDEDEEEEAARRAKAAKAKAKAAAAAASAAAISTSAPSAISSTKRQSAAAKPASPPTEDDDSDDIEDSDDDDEEARRKARKAAKKEQKRQAYKAQTAAAAAQATANAAEARKAPKIDSNSLDFLADMVNSAPMAAAPVAQPKAVKASKAAKSSAPVDLLAFSPVKEAQPAPSMSLLDFASPASAAPEAAAPAKKKGRALELDSFFGAAATTSAAPGGASHPQETTHAAPLDPFFNLPGAESAEPVDLLAIPPPKPQPHIPAQPVSRAPSAPGGAGNTNALDDPFFAAPLPMPASITPKVAAGAGAAKAAKPAAKPAAAAKKKSKSVISSSDESSDSSDSESSDSEQEEGRPAPKKKAAPKAAASKAAASAAAGPAAGAGAGATSDPFDFVQNPTQSQREATATPAARSQQATERAAAKAAEAVQSPKKPAVAAAPSAAAAAAAAAKPPKPVVGRTPSGSLGLSDVYVPSAAAAAPAAPAAAAAASKPKKSKQPDALSPGSASPGAAAASPEDYSPTRDNYSPFPDGQKKPPSDDPFAGTNDW